MVLVAVSCSSAGNPTSYDDQIDATTGLSNVELNWTQGCEPSLGEDLADHAVSICQCSFARIKASVPFDAFVEVNDRFGSNPEILGSLAADGNATAAELVQIVKNCIADA